MVHKDAVTLVSMYVGPQVDRLCPGFKGKGVKTSGKERKIGEGRKGVGKRKKRRENADGLGTCERG